MSADTSGLVQGGAPPTLEQHQAAFGEVAFLLDIFAQTIDDLMGGSTVTVGRSAGREAGRKLPVYLAHPTLDAVLPCVATQLARGWDIQYAAGDEGVALQIGRCAVRSVCELRGQAPGGALCALFHAYLDGVVNELTHRPTLSSIESTGPICHVRLRTR